jgi:hypothetical protein
MSSTPGECIDSKRLPEGKPDGEGQQVVSSWEPLEPSAAKEDGEDQLQPDSIRAIDLNSLAQTNVDPGFGLDIEAVLPFLEFDYGPPVVFDPDAEDDSGVYDIE